MGTIKSKNEKIMSEKNYQERYLRSTKNAYKMMWVSLYRFAFDIVLFYLAWIWFRYESFTDLNSKGFRYNYLMTIIYAFVLYIFKKTYSANLIGYSRIRTIAQAQWISQVFSIVITYVGVSVAWQRFRVPWIFIVLLLIQLLIDVLWAYYATEYFYTINPSIRTLLVYRNEVDRMRFGAIKGKPIERLYKITESLRFDGKFEEIEDVLENYDAVFVAGVNSPCRNEILKYCKRTGMPGFFLPHVGDAIMREAVHVKSFDSPVLYVNRTIVDPIYAFVKRAFDIVVSGFALIILSPIIIVTALTVKIYDHGPILYRQTRLTKEGKTFRILKFRSMRVDAEKDGVARLSSGDDDTRITPIGRFIRKCRIDELPQLINIFKGDMSVVGPRPERPEIAEQYYQTVPDFKLRLQVKAGLTGYAQVYGKYNTDPYEKLEFDLLYINQMNLMTDIQLCFATFFVLFQSESTSGIAEGQTNALKTNKHSKILYDYEKSSEKQDIDH